MVTTISSTISPTPKAMFPLAPCTSLGRKGAPAAVASTINPIWSDCSSGMTSVMSVGQQRHQHEVGQQRQEHQAHVLEGLHDLRHGQAQAHRQHAGDDEQQSRNRAKGLE